MSARVRCLSSFFAVSIAACGGTHPTVLELRRDALEATTELRALLQTSNEAGPTSRQLVPKLAALKDTLQKLEYDAELKRLVEVEAMSEQLAELDAQILELQRREAPRIMELYCGNTNGRSFALALGARRVLSAAADAELVAISSAIKARVVGGAR